MQFILAPLQGYTENEFRNAWSSVFVGLDYAISPFIALAAGSRFRLAHLRDVLPENNKNMPLVPQVLGNDAEKFILLSQRLHDLGYTEVNWNLGCPKRSVASKKRGSGLLPFPELLREILDEIIPKMPVNLSIKTRLGYQKPEEFYDLIGVYNDFPLQSLIIHPRTGIQEYEGEMHLKLLRETISELKHPLVFSGDIMDKPSFDNLSGLFPEISRWMIGRGALANPFLPEMLTHKQVSQNENEIRRRLIEFHSTLFDEISRKVGKEKSVLNKMKDFWSYFALWFDESPSIFHLLAHLHSVEDFGRESEKILTCGILSPFEGRSNRQLKTRDFC